MKIHCSYAKFVVHFSYEEFRRLSESCDNTDYNNIMRNYVNIFNHGIEVGEDFDELTDFI